MKMNRIFALVLILFSLGCTKKKPLQKGDDFYSLEGKNTSRWQYVNQVEDVNSLNLFSKVYDLRVDLQNEPLEQYRIPTIIHVIWLGPRSFPINSIDTLRSWIANHPDWDFYFWTDRERVIPVKGLKIKQTSEFRFEKLGRFYNESTNWAEKSDILRYEILNKMGGIYMDHDAFCLQSFKKLNQAYDFYACLEVPHPEIDGLCITAGIGIIGAIPGHPIIQGAIDHIYSTWDKKTLEFSTTDKLTQVEKVMHRTYIALTHSLRKNLNSSLKNDIVFPASYFYPMEDLSGIYSKHLYATSWNFYSEESKTKFAYGKIKKPYKKYSKVLNLYILLCVISLIAVCLGIISIKRNRV